MPKIAAMVNAVDIDAYVTISNCSHLFRNLKLPAVTLVCLFYAQLIAIY
jgi:hypothetical protein